MPTVSTVENTTSARLIGRSDESTVAKSPPYPPRLEAALQRRTRRPRPCRRLRPLEVVADGVSTLGELIHPVKRIAGRRARLELERRAPLGRIPEEIEDGGTGRRR